MAPTGSPGAEAACTPNRQLPILMVDDDQVMCTILRALLKSCGQYEFVSTAADGIEALGAIERRHDEGAPPFALVFMDIDMPRMRGDDAIAELRSREAAGMRARTQVVGLSTFSDSEGSTGVDACVAREMDAWVTKPMTKDRLERILYSCSAPPDEMPACAPARRQPM